MPCESLQTVDLYDATDETTVYFPVDLTEEEGAWKAGTDRTAWLGEVTDWDDANYAVSANKARYHT